MSGDEEGRPIAPRGADGYEAGFMEGEGEVLFRDKMVGRWPWHAALLSPALAAAVGTAIPLLSTDSTPMGVGMALGAAALVGAACVPLWLLFSVLRVTVSTGKVHIQFGLWGPEIPVAAVVDCEAVAYDWKQYGGFGIKWGRDGSTIYNMIGDGARAVRIRWMKDGKEKITVVSSHDPIGLAEAVNEARRRAGAGSGESDEVLYEEEQRRSDRGKEAANPKVRVEGEDADQEEAVEVEEASAKQRKR